MFNAPKNTPSSDHLFLTAPVYYDRYHCAKGQINEILTNVLFPFSVSGKCGPDS